MCRSGVRRFNLVRLFLRVYQTADFARSDSSNIALDKVPNFTANLSGEHLEEFNKTAFGISESAATIRHAVKDLRAQAAKPTPLYNPAILPRLLTHFDELEQHLEVARESVVLATTTGQNSPWFFCWPSQNRCSPVLRVSMFSGLALTTDSCALGFRSGRTKCRTLTRNY